jgi:hypothetical protein
MKEYKIGDTITYYDPYTFEPQDDAVVISEGVLVIKDECKFTEYKVQYGNGNIGTAFFPHKV